jgi:hypothetical protein
MSEIKCAVKQIESADPKKRERKEKDTVVAFSVLGKEFHGISENLQTEQGLRMFLITISDELEMAGALNPYPSVKEAFFALKTPFIPAEVLEAVRG